VSGTKTAFDWTHGSPTFPKRAEVKLKCGVAVSLQQPVLEDGQGCGEVVGAVGRNPYEHSVVGSKRALGLDSSIDKSCVL
jgi:hypothetical protein